MNSTPHISKKWMDILLLHKTPSKRYTEICFRLSYMYLLSRTYKTKADSPILKSLFEF